MKKNLALLNLVAVLAVTAGFVYAGSRVAMRVNVPFDFYVENQLFPAGEYHFEMGSSNLSTASQVTVRAINSQEVKMLATLPGIDANTTTNVLRFNKYDDTYFLSAVSIYGHEATLREFNLEKDLRSRLEKSRNTTTITQE
jgi:hypothetical protein